ncbi:MAG: hypothetical protein ACI3Y2_00690 [Candidatus Egerieousia sp.]
MRESQKQIRQVRTGKRIGIVLTLAVHIVVLLVFGVTGFKLIYPPPAERGILLEIPVEEVRVLKVTQTGKEPTSQNPKPDKPVNLIQKSKAQAVSQKSSASKASTVGEHGDVEKYEPKREKIDSRSLFTSADNRVTKEAQQTADKVSKALKAGNPQGNTENGPTTGEPSAKLAGRNVNGLLPKPDYTVNKAGVVVVKIMVNRKGEVTNAIPGQKGTTVTDPALWAAAKRAALKARFSESPNAAVTQVGTITYVFTLQ